MTEQIATKGTDKFSDQDMADYLEKQAAYYTAKFVRQGLRAEFEDIYGELAVTAAQARRIYRDNDQRGASFKTYLANAFYNRSVDLWEELMEASASGMVYIEDCPALVDREAHVTQDSHGLAIRDLLSLFHGTERLVAKELVDPSEKVAKIARAYDQRTPGRGKPNGLARAICKVYGIDQGPDYIVKKIREKIKKSLDSVA